MVIWVTCFRYSDSEGAPSEKGLQSDGKAILKYAFNYKEIDNQQIFVHGRSLGGAVLIYSALLTNYNVFLPLFLI